jgi:hypothetical protein
MSHKKESSKALKAHVETSEEQVQLAAYYRWQENGEQHGCDLDDWYEAEKSCCD